MLFTRTTLVTWASLVGFDMEKDFSIETHGNFTHFPLPPLFMLIKTRSLHLESSLPTIRTC